MVGKILIALLTVAGLFLVYNLLFAGKAQAKPVAGAWDGPAYAAIRSRELAANQGPGHF